MLQNKIAAAKKYILKGGKMLQKGVFVDMEFLGGNLKSFLKCRKTLLKVV